MTGPNERKLAMVESANPHAIDTAAQQWQKAAQTLGHLVTRLHTVKGEIAGAWTGKDSDAATAAFTNLAGHVDNVRGKMHTGSQGLTDAATALRKAQHAYADLPAIVPAPAPLDPHRDQSDAGEPAGMSRAQLIHAKLEGQHTRSINARENEAGTAYKALVSGLGHASGKLSTAAPESAGVEDSGLHGGSGPGGGSVSGGGGGTGGGSVGPYATGTGGSYVGGGVGGGGATAPGTPVLGGVAG
ncbi:MAG: WXG100 family type VII secretion target, partial [Sciscionella sp.]